MKRGLELRGETVAPFPLFHVEQHQQHNTNGRSWRRCWRNSVGRSFRENQTRDRPPASDSFGARNQALTHLLRTLGPGQRTGIRYSELNRDASHTASTALGVRTV